MLGGKSRVGRYEMGSQSIRASETKDSELTVYLCLFLFLCLGSLSRPADQGHTHQRDYRGSLNVELGPSEILTTANPRAFISVQEPTDVLVTANREAFVLKQGTSEEIAIANTASNKFGKYFSRVNYLTQEKRKVATMAHSIAYSVSINPDKARFLESFEDDRYHLFAISAGWASDCLIDDTVLGHESVESMGKKKLGHLEECFNKTVGPYYNIGLSLSNDLELRARVISVVLAGIIILAVILIMAKKEIREVILFKSNNGFNALMLEESDLDESYQTDLIIYEILLKEAVLVSSEGSSGQVFKVRFLGLDCAMKVFHSSARKEFRIESIILLNLSHPHVVKFFCSFRKSFVIMELMDEDLYSFIAKIRERRIDYDMPLEVALDIMLQIAEGMSYLHHQGIAHQDLKSLNILLKLRGDFHDPDFQIIAKVADLGSARRFNPSYPKAFVLAPNTNIGTRSWRAPELFDSGKGFMSSILGVNPRVLPKPLDIYGFAVICSELLTKQIPFSDDQDLRVAVLGSKLREGHRPALPCSGCPEGLLALIMDCWHGDPVLRPEFHEVCTRLLEVKSSWMSGGDRLSES